MLIQDFLRRSARYLPQLKSPIEKFCAMLLSVGLVLRLINLHDFVLWEDELISVAFAESGLFEILVGIVRYDVHPPLYYAQLWIWSWFGKSDLWYGINSLVLSLGAIVSVYIASHRLFDERRALFIASIFAILPLGIHFTTNVRMYPLFFIFTIWLWYFVERILQDERIDTRQWICLVLFGAVSVLTHGAGFIITFFALLYGALLILRNKMMPRYLPYTVACVLALSPSVIPLVLSALRSTVGLDSLNLNEIGINLTLFLLGLQFPFPSIAGAIALVFLIARLKSADAWQRLLLLVLLPMVVLLALSVTIKPVFFFRTLGMLLPFLAVSLGLWFASSSADDSDRSRTYAFVVTALVFIASGINYTSTYQKNNRSDRLPQAWSEQSKPGEQLYVEQPQSMWAFQRYGSTSSVFESVLDVQPPMSDKLKRVEGALGKDLFAFLNFGGKTDHAFIDGRKVMPYLPETLELAPGASVWLSGKDDNVSCEAFGFASDVTLNQGRTTLLKCTHAHSAQP